MKKSNLLLYGGGLDSTAYLILMKQKQIDFKCFWVDYGQQSKKGELAACKYFCNKYNIPLITEKNNQIKQYNNIAESQLFTGNSNHDPYIYGRNLSLIMQALEYGNNIYLGFTNPGYQPFPDATIDFVGELNNLLQKVFNSVIIHAPFMYEHRVNILVKAYKIDDTLFSKSCTCWCCNDDGLECSVCKHCILKQSQLKEVIHYVQKG